MTKLALNLAQKLKAGDLHITKADITPQDMTFQDEKLDRLKKQMKDHKGLNKTWDPEIKTKQFAEVDDVRIDPNTSRQVRRQIERLIKKAGRTHKFGKKMIVDYNHRVQLIEDPKTRLVKYALTPINRPCLTQVNTSRYVPHAGLGVRYTPNFGRSTL